MEKFKKIRNIVVLLLIAGFIVYAIKMFHQLNLETSRNPVIASDTSNANYVSLFNQEAKDELILNKTLSFVQRNPISLFSYNKLYSIEITRINLASDLDLNKDIAEVFAKSERTGNIVYVPISENGLTVDYRSTSLISPSKIHLTMYGDSIRSIAKNDSLYCDYIKLGDFSIRYEHSDVNEISAENNQSLAVNKRPVILMFFKRHKSLYFLLLTANDLSTKLDPTLLYKLIDVRS